MWTQYLLKLRDKTVHFQLDILIDSVSRDKIFGAVAGDQFCQYRNSVVTQYKLRQLFFPFIHRLYANHSFPGGRANTTHK